MALLLSTTTTMGQAWAASTGIDYSSGAIDITYGSGEEVQGTWHESVLTVDDEWVYCANVNAEFAEGLNVSCEDPVATGTWSQAMVTDLALASDFIWAGKFKSSVENGDGHMITSNLEKYAVTQVLVWEIMDSYGYSDFGWFGAGIGDLGLTGSDDGHADCWAYIAENRATMIGHANYYDGGSAQSVVCGFWVEPVGPSLGSISLVKRSANKSISKNNDCYNLKGAVYGVFETKDAAKTHEAKKALDTYKTDADGTWSSKGVYEEGTYYIAEITAPRGFALDKTVYTVDVTAGKNARVNAETGYTLDEPQSNPVKLWAKKTDAETANGNAQGSATLKGTQFEIAYYDGYYKKSTLPDKATRTWIVASDQDGKAYANEDLKISGDKFYYTSDGEITIPLGTVTVREINPPKKYLFDDEADEAGGMELIQIKADDARKTLSVYIAPTFSDHVMRGGVAVGKVDRQTGMYLPQGAATLAGAEFEITSLNEQRVIVDKTSYKTGEVVKVIKTKLVDGTYIARTNDHCLPVGSYSIRESATSKGYAYDKTSKSWSRNFEITKDGQVVDLTNPTDAASNQVVRGDFSFTKIDGRTGDHLAFVPFLVTAASTGERHVIMTDKNGAFSTSATWANHTNKTNANDAALSESASGYLLDEKALDVSAGTWFSGSSATACEPDNSLGALPYDTYEVMELRSTANEGYDLASFTVTISRHDVALDLGTVDDKALPVIETTLSDENGEHLVAANSLAKVVDTVRYSNLDMGAQYTLDGSLHLVAEDGSDGGVLASAQTPFSPTAADGAIEVEFTVDTSVLEGCRLVASERLIDAQGNVVALHEDLADEEQTVFVPTIGTMLTDSFDGSHETSSHEEVTLVDTVAFRGLVPGKAYVMTGTLHVKDDSGADAGVALDAKGDPITASQTFTPDVPEGTVEVSFTFSAPNNAGASLVAFEELLREDIAYAVHADIADDNQTVHMPAIGTTLIDAADGDHIATVDEAITLLDRVAYNGLTVGQPYTITGTLHVRGDDGTDHGVALDAQDNPITASQTFTPEASAGEVEVAFMFEAPDLAGKSVVAFEELLCNERICASHADIADEGQTVHIPAIGTTLIDAADGDHSAKADEAITLIDRVAYSELIAGQPYTVAGTLHVRGDDGSDKGEALDAKGNPITASQTFTPEASSGEIEVAFMFEAPDLAGKSVVAFEELFFNERVCASHADIADEGQTVQFAPPREKEGEPPEKETPPKETPPKETPPEQETPPTVTPPPTVTTPPTTDTPVGKTALPKTGDGIDAMVFIVIAGAAVGVAAGVLCLRATRRNREITINRGPLDQ